MRVAGIAAISLDDWTWNGGKLALLVCVSTSAGASPVVPQRSSGSSRSTIVGMARLSVTVRALREHQDLWEMGAGRLEGKLAT